jgi:hypothetical protein
MGKFCIRIDFKIEYPDVQMFDSPVVINIIRVT